MSVQEEEFNPYLDITYRVPRGLDPEMTAIATIQLILQPLTPIQQRSVMAYLKIRTDRNGGIVSASE